MKNKIITILILLVVNIVLVKGKNIEPTERDTLKITFSFHDADNNKILTNVGMTVLSVCSYTKKSQGDRSADDDGFQRYSTLTGLERELYFYKEGYKTTCVYLDTRYLYGDMTNNSCYMLKVSVELQPDPFYEPDKLVISGGKHIRFINLDDSISTEYSSWWNNIYGGSSALDPNIPDSLQKTLESDDVVFQAILDSKFGIKGGIVTISNVSCMTLGFARPIAITDTIFEHSFSSQGEWELRFEIPGMLPKVIRLDFRLVPRTGLNALVKIKLKFDLLNEFTDIQNLDRPLSVFYYDMDSKSTLWSNGVSNYMRNLILSRKNKIK